MGKSASLPPGWTTEPARILGERQEVGDGRFRHGKRPLIRSVVLPESGRHAVLIANELGDLRMYEGFGTDSPRPVPFYVVGDAGPDDIGPLGYSGTGIPDLHRRVAAVPHRGGPTWDLVMCRAGDGTMTRSVWKAEGADVRVDWPRDMPAPDVAGIPEAVDWRRDGWCDLLVGTEDGRLLRLPRRIGVESLEFESAGVPVIGGEVPIGLPGPLCPCVLDWYGEGKSDLLLGAGDGYLWLFRDIGDESEVRYERGRLLCNADGHLRVDGPASPTVVEEEGRRWLLAADGEGAVWRWEITTVDAVVTDDLHAAAGGEANGVRASYVRGTWWMLNDGGATVLCAGPDVVPPKAEHKSVPTIFDPAAPELMVKSPVVGHCEIHLTLHFRGVSERDEYRLSADNRPMLKVRLSDEEVGEYAATGEWVSRPEQEVFLKCADLTGKDIGLSQLVGGLQYEGGFPVCVSKIRLVPVDPVPWRARAEAPVVAGISDTMDWVNHVRMETAEEVDEFVAQHERAGIKRLYMKMGGASWEYPSKYPEARGVAPDLPSYTDADKRYCDKQSEMLERVNRLKLAAEACHRRGMKCIGQMRIQNASEHIHQQTNLDRFFVDHPELMDKDVFGNPTTKLCLAYPEVVDYFTRIGAEVVEFGMDGVMIETLRHLPKVMYGDPVVAEFRERHGLDMRSLPPFDPRVVERQCEIFARFMRAMRDAIKAVNPDAELHIRLCKAHALMAVDPGLLAREGLVDEIIILHRAGAPTEPDVEGLMRVVEGTGVRASACFARTHTWGIEQMPLHPYIIETRTKKYVDLGASSVAFYETVNVLRYPELRRAMSRITDPSDLSSRVF